MASSSSIKTPDFNESMYTTKTILYTTNYHINLLPLANILPLDKIIFSKPWKKTTKPKIKAYPPLGTIYSIRMQGFYRGVLGPYFKNSLMADFSLGTRSVNIHFSDKSILLLGCKEVNYSEYIINFIKEVMSYGNEMLSLIEEHRENLQFFFDYIQQETMGEEFTREVYIIDRTRVKDKNKLRRKLNGTENVKKFNFVLSVDELCQKFPSLPVILVSFLYNRYKECEAYEDACIINNYFNNDYSKRVFVENNNEPLTIEIKNSKNVMVNCSFSLEFPIKKKELKNVINETQTDFIAHYHPNSDHCVNVELLSCDKEKYELQKDNREEMVSHTFIVYEKGRVMMSSKSLEGVKDAFNKFRKMIESIIPQVMDTPQNNKSIPTDSNKVNVQVIESSENRKRKRQVQ